MMDDYPAAKTDPDWHDIWAQYFYDQGNHLHPWEDAGEFVKRQYRVLVASLVVAARHRVDYVRPCVLCPADDCPIVLPCAECPVRRRA